MLYVCPQTKKKKFLYRSRTFTTSQGDCMLHVRPGVMFLEDKSNAIFGNGEARLSNNHAAFQGGEWYAASYRHHRGYVLVHDNPPESFVVRAYTGCPSPVFQA